jgi:hypothetical protein
LADVLVAEAEDGEEPDSDVGGAKLTVMSSAARAGSAELTSNASSVKANRDE